MEKLAPEQKKGSVLSLGFFYAMGHKKIIFPGCENN